MPRNYNSSTKNYYKHYKQIAVVSFNPRKTIHIKDDFKDASSEYNFINGQVTKEYFSEKPRSYESDTKFLEACNVDMFGETSE